MREILSISLSSDLKKKINRASRQYKLSQSEIVKRAVDKYLVSMEFLRLRSKLIPYAEKKGYYSEEDIFNDKEIS